MYRKSYCTTSSVGMVMALPLALEAALELENMVKCDGQGTFRQAVLFVDRSCYGV